MTGALSMAVGTLLLVQPKDGLPKLIGFLVLVSAPIIASAFVVSLKQRPVLWNFDAETVQIKFHNPRYFMRFEEWLKTQGYN